MAVENSLRRNQYVSAASQTTFIYDFKIFKASDLTVVRLPVDTFLDVPVDPSEYTVTGIGEDSGGTIVFDVGQTLNDTITIEGDILEERTTDFQTSGPLPATAMNRELDSIVIMVMEAIRDIGRTLQLSISTPDDFDAVLPFPEVGKIIGWDNQVDPPKKLVNYPSISGIPQAHVDRAIVVMDGVNTGQATSVDGVTVAQDAAALIDNDRWLIGNDTDQIGLTVKRGNTTDKIPFYALDSSDDTRYYLFFANDGRLRVHTAIPTADTDGVEVPRVDKNNVYTKTQVHERGADLAVSTGTATWDVDTNPNARMVFDDENVTLVMQNWANLEVGAWVDLDVKQAPSGGPFNVTWPAYIDWPNGTPPSAISTPANAVDSFCFKLIDQTGPIVHGFAAQGFG